MLAITDVGQFVGRCETVELVADLDLVAQGVTIIRTLLEHDHGRGIRSSLDLAVAGSARSPEPDDRRCAASGQAHEWRRGPSAWVVLRS